MLSNLSTSQFGSDSATLSALFNTTNPSVTSSVYGALHPTLTSSTAFTANTNVGHLSKPFPAMFSTASSGDLSLSLPYPQTSSGFESSQMLQLKSPKERSMSKSSSPTLSPGPLNTNQCGTSGSQSEVRTVLLYGIPIVSLVMDGQERLCLAQISNTLLKNYSYNEIHNRRVALGITCVQCTPVQLELLRRAGAMPVSSRRCGMITKREAERLCKSFLTETAPPKLPENFSFDVYHCCAWGCRGSFTPSRYNSSRAKCIKCLYCGLFFSPNKFIFHSHRLPTSKYVQPDAANFNSWRRHIRLVESPEPTEQVVYAWEDVKAMFNGGSRKRAINSTLTSFTKNQEQEQQNSKNAAKKIKEMDELDDDSDSIGVADDIDPTVSSFDIADILDNDQSSNEETQKNSQKSHQASPPSPPNNEQTALSKPFWSMEAYLNPSHLKTRHNSFGAYPDSLMHSAYPFTSRPSGPLQEARITGTPHPAILNTILNNVPDNYHFRQSLIAASANGYVPGTSNTTPTTELSPKTSTPTFAELMWTMAARNGAAAAAAAAVGNVPIGGGGGPPTLPYNLLWSQNSSQNSRPLFGPQTQSSQFDSDELRKALLMNPQLFPNRSQTDFFASPEFAFLPPFRPLLDSTLSFETDKTMHHKRPSKHDELKGQEINNKRIKICNRENETGNTEHEDACSDLKDNKSTDHSGSKADKVDGDNGDVM